METMDINSGLEVFLRDPFTIIISYLNKPYIKNLLLTNRILLSKVKKKIRIFKYLNEKEINMLIYMENVINLKIENYGNIKIFY